MNRAAVVIGGLRCASGVSFLVAPEKANKAWGDKEPPTPTTALLLRSMGYRDALVGGLLLSAGLRNAPSRGWFLASAGADAADLVGGLSVHDQLPRAQQVIGLGGAAVGIGVGLWGALRRGCAPRTSPNEVPADARARRTRTLWPARHGPRH